MHILINFNTGLPPGVDLIKLFGVNLLFCKLDLFTSTEIILHYYETAQLKNRIYSKFLYNTQCKALTFVGKFTYFFMALKEIYFN